MILRLQADNESYAKKKEYVVAVNSGSATFQVIDLMSRSGVLAWVWGHI